MKNGVRPKDYALDTFCACSFSYVFRFLWHMILGRSEKMAVGLSQIIHQRLESIATEVVRSLRLNYSIATRKGVDSCRSEFIAKFF